MIAVVFEVWPRPGARETYFDHAARLRPLLDEIDGFLCVERFQSLTDPEKTLSLSFWRDEAAVATWRGRSSHRATQAAGRSTMFADYRLRVAHVVRDYGMTAREQAPPDSRAAHDAR